MLNDRLFFGNCRQKGLLAISCLIRNNPEGLSAFETADGVAKLVKVVNTDVPKVQRYASVTMHI